MPKLLDRLITIINHRDDYTLSSEEWQEYELYGIESAVKLINDNRGWEPNEALAYDLLNAVRRQHAAEAIAAAYEARDNVPIKNRP